MNKSVKIQTVSPEDLHMVLSPTVMGKIRFRDDKEMTRYRSRLYSINKHNAAGYRYKTEREHRTSLHLYVWRMS